MENKELLQKLNFLIKEINETHTRLQNAKTHFQPIESALLTQQVVNLYGHLAQLNDSLSATKTKQTPQSAPKPAFTETEPAAVKPVPKKEESQAPAPIAQPKPEAVVEQTPAPEKVKEPVQEAPIYNKPIEEKPTFQAVEIENKPLFNEAVKTEEPQPEPEPKAESEIKQEKPVNTTYSARTDSGRFDNEPEVKPTTAPSQPEKTNNSEPIQQKPAEPEIKNEPIPEPIPSVAQAEEKKENIEVKETGKAEITPTPETIKPEIKEEVTKDETALQEPKPEPVKQVMEEPVENKTSATASSSTINSRDAGNQQMSLNERFAQNTVKKNLADKLKLSPIKDLKSAMGLNQRISFIKVLFQGNDEEFRNAVNIINEAGSFSEAKNYIQSELASKNNWNEENHVTQEFMELVYRKFL